MFDCIRYCSILDSSSAFPDSFPILEVVKLLPSELEFVIMYQCLLCIFNPQFLSLEVFILWAAGGFKTDLAPEESTEFDN